MELHKLNPESFPDLNSMLASIIRLMSCFVRDPSESQIMTLLHLLECIKHHPDFADNIAVKISVSQAREIWEEQFRFSRSNYAQYCVHQDNKDLH